ncbi:MAG: hypothetical protein WAK71_19570 [Streptosporangiaceae bacterium]
MSSWIDLTALWQIVVVGLIAGAGLPALFAIGLKAMSLSGGARTQPASATGPEGRTAQNTPKDGIIGGSVPGLIAGALCFLIVLAAIGWGIWAIYQAGHPK